MDAKPEHDPKKKKRAKTSQKGWQTPPQVSSEFGVKIDLVRGWINEGTLRAINMAANPNGERPRWRIARVDLEAFLAERANKPAAPPPAKPVRRRRKSTTPPKQWF